MAPVLRDRCYRAISHTKHNILDRALLDGHISDKLVRHSPSCFELSELA